MNYTIFTFTPQKLSVFKTDIRKSTICHFSKKIFPSSIRPISSYTIIHPTPIFEITLKPP